MGKMKDLTGQVFSRLTPTHTVGKNKHHVYMWHCVCECGNISIVPSKALLSSNTKSCGCLDKETVIQRNTVHGLHKHELYNTWKGIRSRCNCKSSSGYYKYGARGITVCPEWDSFEVFLGDMGDRPQGYTIDRIDNDGPYSKENCRWASNAQQAVNKRNTVYFTYDGVTKPVMMWAEELGVDARYMRSKRNNGLTDKEIIDMIINSKGKAKK